MRKENLKVFYDNENGERICAVYDSIRMFINAIDSDEIDIPMLDYENVDAYFYENPAPHHFDTIQDLYGYCRAVTGGEKAQESAALRTFIVTIEERVSQSFAVQAKNTEEAMEIANQKYDDGEFVIDSPKVTHRCMQAGDGFETTEWIEF